MLRPKSTQNSFYGSYLYDNIIPKDHLLRRINEVVDFSFIKDLVKDRYTKNFGRPAEDPVVHVHATIFPEPHIYIYDGLYHIPPEKGFTGKAERSGVPAKVLTPLR